MTKVVAGVVNFIVFVIIVNIMHRVVFVGVGDGLEHTILIYGSTFIIQSVLNFGIIWSFNSIIDEAYEAGKYTSAINYSRLFKPVMMLLGEPEALQSVILFDARRYDEAEQVAMQGLNRTEDGQYVAVYASVMALVEYQRGHLAQAIHYLEKVCKQQDDFGGSHMYLAQFYLDNGSVTEATKVIKKILMNKRKIKDKSSIGHLEIALARSLVKSGKPKESLEMLKQGLGKIKESNIPARAEAFYWAGRMFHENNRPDYALKYYKQATSTDPNGHWGYSAQHLVEQIKNPKPAHSGKSRSKKRQTDSLLRQLEGR